MWLMEDIHLYKVVTKCGKTDVNHKESKYLTNKCIQ
jgi:hypothetical protein